MYNAFLKKINSIQSIDASCLVKKADCNTNIVENEKKNTWPREIYDYSWI